MVFDDEFYIVTLIWEGKITPNWTDIVQYIPQSGAPDNIDLKYTWFTSDLEENPRKKTKLRSERHSREFHFVSVCKHAQECLSGEEASVSEVI